MEIKEMQMSDIEQRSAEIEEMLKAEDADIDTISEEVKALEERKAEIETEVEERKAEMEEALNNSIEIEPIEERKEMNEKEIRSSKEYIDAYVKYVKTGKDAECRSLLSENVSGGTVPVPTYLEDRVRTAWDNDGILSRVKKSFFKGNVKVGVELSGDAAVVHTEGAAAPSEEALALYIAELVPETIKKWVKVSDEVLDSNEAFLDYLYREIEYKLVKKAADLIVADITGLATSSTNAPIRGEIAHSGINDVLNAFATLCDEAANPVVIMNKTSYAYYRGLANSANYNVDPFEGLPVIFNDTLANANATGTGMCVIVGDLDGVQANFPQGFEPTFKYDDLSLAESDLVKIVGRLPMGHEVVATKFFATVKQAAA